MHVRRLGITIKFATERAQLFIDSHISFQATRIFWTRNQTTCDVGYTEKTNKARLSFRIDLLISRLAETWTACSSRHSLFEWNIRDLLLIGKLQKKSRHHNVFDLRPRDISYSAICRINMKMFAVWFATVEGWLLRFMLTTSICTIRT